MIDMAIIMEQSNVTQPIPLNLQVLYTIISSVATKFGSYYLLHHPSLHCFVMCLIEMLLVLCYIDCSPSPSSLLHSEMVISWLCMQIKSLIWPQFCVMIKWLLCFFFLLIFSNSLTQTTLRTALYKQYRDWCLSYGPWHSCTLLLWLLRYNYCFILHKRQVINSKQDWILVKPSLHVLMFVFFFSLMRRITQALSQNS